MIHLISLLPFLTFPLSLSLSHICEAARVNKNRKEVVSGGRVKKDMEAVPVGTLRKVGPGSELSPSLKKSGGDEKWLCVRACQGMSTE